MRTIDSTTSLHTAALTDRVKRGDVRAFYRPFAERYPSVRNRFLKVQRAVMFIGAALGFLGVPLLAVGVVLVVSNARADRVVGDLSMVITGLVMIGGGVFFGWFFLRFSTRRGTPKRHYRLSRFATDNGLSYEPGPITGAHVTPWASRGLLTLTRVMRPVSEVSERSIEFANHELRYGVAGTGTAQFGGFCAVRLSTRLPHILLRAQDGPGDRFTLVDLPASSQRLSLEGDFNDYYTLYCPEKYERDALYLFTPDVMARLIDRVRGFDVEIIDDWLFLVSSRDVVTLDPDAWQALYDAVGALSDKIGRWERWRDDRMPAVPRVTTGTDAGTAAVELKPAPRSGRVAKRGRRLRMRLGVGTWIGLIAFALLMVGGVVSMFHQGG
ncbi:hypothetical protein C3B61_17515 [Cryobacterium zongtaii]|uniref:DUF3137 domain-containing protein n=1 Tax=Cryobacterium zongtaii TaxID=1259217 RepID=A0A2S3ZAN3_9MICO|nr:hypothetical protein [Cryobacterium zongtaii]POH62638.1 hypothetical protein C3B61_17515 [Cryobacterium zongtaii]